MSTTLSAAESLPRWDLDVLFPAPDSPELRDAIQSAQAGAAELLEAIAGAERDRPMADSLTQIIDRYNALLELATRIEGYLYCLVAADVTDEAASAASSAWDIVKADLGGVAPRFTALLGPLNLKELATQSATVAAHLPTLQRVHDLGAHLMPAGEEELAAQLGVSGASAWSSLRDDLGGRATVTIDVGGEPKEMALSEASTFAYSVDRAVRQRADEAVNATWESLSVPLAAAINAVKAQQRVLAARRGWDDPLDVSLAQNAIDRETLNAMQTAIREAIPDYQRYLRAKARLLGVPRLAGYDLDAPVGEPMDWPYSRAQEFVLETFAAEHRPLAELAERAFRENWIDAEPRQGKDGGGFSIGVGGEATRIFMNYLPFYDQMSTLAHELGHSYHSAVAAQAGRTALQNPPDDIPAPITFPMTLAETASTLCEALAQRAARAEATGAQALSLLDSWLIAFSATVFDTHVRFVVEQQIFAARGERALSPAELTEITREAWVSVTGDAVDPETVAVYRWTKPHFFIEDITYYNYPYAFGLLFALGLLVVKDREPDGFYERLDALLADSGMRTASDLAADFGINLHDPEFWRGGFTGYRADITAYEELAAQANPAT